MMSGVELPFQGLPVSDVVVTRNFPNSVHETFMRITAEARITEGKFTLCTLPQVWGTAAVVGGAGAESSATPCAAVSSLVGAECRNLADEIAYVRPVCRRYIVVNKALFAHPVASVQLTDHICRIQLVCIQVEHPGRNTSHRCVGDLADAG